MNELIWIEISRQNLEHNIKTFRSIIGDKVLLVPSVKSNAYGHGLIEIAKISAEAGADWLCVNTIDEVITLRGAGISLPVLIMGYVLSEDLEKIIDNNAKIFLYDVNIAKEISKIAQARKTEVNVHVKIDTGMGRQGVLINEAVDFIKAVRELPGLNVEGAATHFATADELQNRKYYKKQFEEFDKIRIELEDENIIIPITHSSNSAATLMDKKSHFDLVRPGISIYGLYPSEEVKKECLARKMELKPIISLKTKIVSLKSLKKGSGISYGLTCLLERDTRVAVLPIGYYDGIDRRLSNIGEVLIRGKRAKILGRVCMNMMMVDVTGINDAKIGDEVVVIGKQGSEEVSVDEIAEIIGTINYEVTTRLRENTKKVIIKK